MTPVAGLTALFVFAALTTDAALAEKMDSGAGYFLPRCRAVVEWHRTDGSFPSSWCADGSSERLYIAAAARGNVEDTKRIVC
jgi:hypothetical protein